MPIYRFKCTNCGTVVEKLESMQQTHNSIHRLCSCTSTLHRFNKIIEASPVLFRGTGWADKETG